jgi:sulfate transport system permease protein
VPSVATGPGVPDAPGSSRGRARRRLPEGTLGLGVGSLWLSLIVLLPIAAVAAKALGGGLGEFWDAATAPAARSALGLTLVVSLIIAVVNAVTGTLIAWVLVRDEFPGKRLVNALIDLPFAIPTIVASIVLLSLYGSDSPLGLHLIATRPIIVIALLFVTLPFVVRSVQPVLMEADREAEQAAATLGASNLTIFRRIVLPTIGPALLSGIGLAFARAIGEYGSVVLVDGNIPFKTQVTSQYIAQRIESNQDGVVDTAAAANSIVLLLIAFVVLLVLRLVANRGTRHHAR